MANVKDLIKNLTKDPVEWDSLLLAKRLQPILEELANSGGGGGSNIKVNPEFEWWEPGVTSEAHVYSSLEEAGIVGLTSDTIFLDLKVSIATGEAYGLYRRSRCLIKANGDIELEYKSDDGVSTDLFAITLFEDGSVSITYTGNSI